MKSSSYTLTAATFTLQRIGLKSPLSIAFTSAEAGRKIELSFDGGTNWHTPTYDFNSAAQLVVAVIAPFTDVKVTGAAGNILTVSESS